MRHLRPLGLCLMAAALALAGPAPGQHEQNAGRQDEHRAHHDRPATAPVLAPPPAMQLEHQHLHAQLEQAIHAGGRTAQAARDLQAVLHPHFLEEEQYALPPLGLLEPLAKGQPILRDGQPTPQVRAAIEMSRRLRDNYGKMLAEHRTIVAAIDRLAAAATEENKPPQVHFAEALKLHAQHEEQVLYPAALLLGQYLEQRLAAGPAQHE